MGGNTKWVFPMYLGLLLLQFYGRQQFRIDRIFSLDFVARLVNTYGLYFDKIEYFLLTRLQDFN